MAQYVVRLTHTPDQCPSANSKVRDRMLKGMPEMPKLAAKLGIKFVAGPLALATEHESVTIVESDRPEAVEDFIMQSGLMQWNTARVSPARPLQDVISELDKLPPPLY